MKRNSLWGPRLFTDDMALFKNFGITERVKGQFRMDAYNVFNHPVYGFSSTQGNVCIDCSGNAGKITGLESDTQMRQLQFGLKFTFRHRQEQQLREVSSLPVFFCALVIYPHYMQTVPCRSLIIGCLSIRAAGERWRPAGDCIQRFHCSAGGFGCRTIAGSQAVG